MAVKVLFLLAFVTVQVSCGRNSLTFIIDDTYSMDDDIRQVKNASKSIIDIVLNEKSSQIEDIVLVTFNDPSIVFRKRTRDQSELKQALESIIVHGGGDCPEMALSGIKRALEESQSGSYLFVFTDASAKDYGMFEEIKTLCQEKQSQIVFILTSRCTRVSPEANTVYDRIAVASNGQVFRVHKNEVGQVLEYVKETIKGDRTVITSTIVPANTLKDIEFKIDDKTEYAVVSAAGAYVTLEIIDQNNWLMSDAGVHITWTDNVKVLKLMNLPAGTYKARVKGNTDVNIMIFGRTDFTFEHGFSTQVETSLRTTETQPTTDIKAYLMVAVKDPEHSANVQSVELLDMKERVIRRLSLTPVQGDVYATEKFLSPSDTFQIAVIATSRRTGKIVRRIAKTPVTPITPVYVRPELSKTDNYITVKEGAAVDVHCRIRKGKPTPHITWYLKPEHGNNFELLSGKTDDVLHVTNAVTNDYYKCVAQNSEGQDSHTVQLYVQAPPRIVFVQRNYVGVEGDLVMRLPCTAVGHPTPTITWIVDTQVISSDKSQELYVEGNALILKNPKKIHSTNNTHSYVCQASNEFGEAHHTYDVEISAYAYSDKLIPTYGVEKQPYVLKCPLPYTDPSSVRWYKNAIYHHVTGPTLRFDNPTLSDNNNYTCRVSDSSHATSYTFELIFGTPPTSANPSYSIEWNGITETLDCFSTQSPEGKYEWFYNAEKIKDAHSRYLQLNHWGQYSCHVTNPLGSLVIKFKVTTVDKDCLIPKSLFETKHMPLVLDSSLSWPVIPTVGQYLVIPHSDKLKLICDDTPVVKSQSAGNRFNQFPTLRSVYATCDNEESFLVDSVPKKISELDCKENVTPSVEKTATPCLGDNTQLVKIGFHVNGFTEVYQSCVDIVKNVPLYTKMNTIPLETKETFEGESKVVKESCIDECCYETIQLVNANDVSFGPAKKATSMDQFNSVNYCKPNNYTDWHTIERITRTKTQYTVWSGAVRYSKVGAIWTPKYLWKVLKEVESSEMIAIVHENVQKPGSKVCSGECGESSIWFEPEGDRTYCCSLDEFKEALGITIDFNED